MHYSGGANDRVNWKRFQRLDPRYIPSCRVMHPYSEERFFASHPTVGRSAECGMSGVNYFFALTTIISPG